MVNTTHVFVTVFDIVYVFIVIRHLKNIMFCFLDLSKFTKIKTLFYLDFSITTRMFLFLIGFSFNCLFLEFYFSIQRLFFLI